MKTWTYALVLGLAVSLSGCGDTTGGNNGAGNNGALQTIEVTENITADTTWEAGTYVLSGDFRVQAKLTLEPCTVVQADDRIFVNEGGAIVAIGTEECPIKFTSKNSTPAAGDWRYIQIEDDADNGNEFEHVVFEYGGDEHGIINMRGGASFRNSTVRHTSALGLKLHDGTVLEFGDMTFENIPDHPLSISLNDAAMIDGVTTTDVQDDAIRVHNGVMTKDGVWQPQSIPYQLYGDTRIEAELELSPGTILKITGGDRAFVSSGGSIQSLGTDGEPVVFESIKEPAAPGDWQQIRFEDDADPSLFQHTTIRHGGGGSHGVLYTLGGVSLENVTFEDNQDCDIDRAENVTATDTDFVDCAQ